MRYHGGNSIRARKRYSRAALLSERWRHGDGAAARSLLNRRRALQGIAKYGPYSADQIAGAQPSRLEDRRVKLPKQDDRCTFAFCLPTSHLTLPMILSAA